MRGDWRPGKPLKRRSWLLPGGGPRSPARATPTTRTGGLFPARQPKSSATGVGPHAQVVAHDCRLGSRGVLESSATEFLRAARTAAAVTPTGASPARTESAGTFRSGFSSAWRKWLDGSEFDAGVGYDFSHGRGEVSRQDGFGFAAGGPLAAAGADSTVALGALRTRQVHELRAGAVSTTTASCT
jgi:hypothetical protein